MLICRGVHIFKGLSRSSIPLCQVLRSSKGCPLELVEYVASARVPRLRLRCGQVELDVVEGGRDPEALAKDQFIRRWGSMMSDLHVKDWKTGSGVRFGVLEGSRSQWRESRGISLLTNKTMSFEE